MLYIDIAPMSHDTHTKSTILPCLNYYYCYYYYYYCELYSQDSKKHNGDRIDERM